ncbi:MAG: YbaB/EbfC family nucleoid-associated protein [Desulfuromonadaceae bacterium]|nr:YbaB/EbfC family nucleoid-associated protein [Desulfuromonadaceae bacterium]
MAKGMGNMMRQAQQMQRKMEEMQKELESREVEASAGGGMVTVRVSGKQQLLGITLEPDAVDPQDVDMLQDLIMVAVNEGIRKSQEMVQSEMSKLTGGLNIPGLF